jgi:hypothetical protein
VVGAGGPRRRYVLAFGVELDLGRSLMFALLVLDLPAAILSQFVPESLRVWVCCSAEPALGWECNYLPCMAPKS